MYDKTVRRRRAVLALLVVLSLILLTAYFGESSEGGLHSVQRGFLTVVSPIQEGANKALKPVRDLFSWFGDTLHAKSQLAEVRKQNDKLRKEVIAERADEHGYHELLGLYHLDQLSLNSYRPVTATVVGKSPNIWYSTDLDRQGHLLGGAEKRPGGQRRRARRQGRAGRPRRRRGRSDHRQRSRRLGADQRDERDRAWCSRRWAIRTIWCCSTCRRTPRPTAAKTSSPRGPWKARTTRCTRPGIPIGQVSSLKAKKAGSSRSTCIRSPTCTTSTSCRCSRIRRAASRRSWSASQPALPSARPDADGHDGGGEGSPLASSLDGRRRMTPSGSLLTRIAVLVVVVVFFQIGVVSEVPVFGVAVDLSPLVVAFVGLLCGSTIGAATGFAVGLLVDLALVQTLG